MAASRLARNIAKVASGAALGQLAAVLASPLITRLYSTDEFGVLSVYASLLAVLAVAATLRYEVAVPLPETDTEAAPVLGAALLSGFASAALVGLALVVGGEHVARLLNVEALAPLLWLVPIGALLVTVYNSFSFWAIRRSAFGVIARTKVMQSLGAIAVQVAAGTLGAGSAGLLAGHVMGQSGGIASLATTLRTADVTPVTWAKIRAAMRRYVRFPLFTAPGALMNVAAMHVPTVAFAALFGPATAGVFGLTQRVLQLPMRVVGDAIAQVYFGDIASRRRDDPASLAPQFVKTVGLLLGLALLPTTLLFLYGPELFGFVFGAAWRQAGDFGRALAPALLLQFAISPTAHLNALERNGLFLAWNVLRLGLVVAVFAYAVYKGLTPEATVTVYALAMAASYVTIASLWLWAARALAKAGPQVPEAVGPMEG